MTEQEINAAMVEAYAKRLEGVRKVDDDTLELIQNAHFLLGAILQDLEARKRGTQ